MYKHPEEFKYPLDPTVDYRLPENREYAMLAWAEAMYHTGELNQQLRLMNHCVESMEGKLWLAFLWACCYNFTGPWVILSKFPEPPKDMSEFSDWYNSIFDDFRVDTDCRYRKSKMIDAIQSYVDWLDGRTQMEAIMPILNIIDDKERYEQLWDTCESWKYQGRLSTWNYVEAIALVTNWQFNVDCQDFMLDDLTGSESNRNGACWVLGKEELQTKHGVIKATNKKMEAEVAQMLNEEAETIYNKIKKEFGSISEVSRLNVETIFCWFKKKFRERQSRYLFWDADRTWEEITYTQEKFPDVDCSGIWEARKEWLPFYALCENFKEGLHRGADKERMKVFINTGRLDDVYAYQHNLPQIITTKPTSTARSLFDV